LLCSHAAGAIHIPDAEAIHMFIEAAHTLHAACADFLGSARATLHMSPVEAIHMLQLAGHTLHAV